MKKMLMIVMVFAGLSLQVHAQEFVLGSVNIQKILIDVNEGKMAAKKLEDTFKKKQQNLQAEEEKFKKLQEDYQKKMGVMNDQAKMDKEKELQKMYMDVQAKAQSYEKEMRELDRKEKQPILDRLKEIISDVSKEKKVSLTLEISQSPVVYAANQIDLTDEVVTRYNKQFPGKK